MKPILLILAILLSSCTHNEGTVKYDDCREIINLDKDSWRFRVYPFTCEYFRDNNGKIIGGTCVRVELADGIFSKSGRCEKAYVYTFWNDNK
jgi:hypothetical protein